MRIIMAAVAMVLTLVGARAQSVDVLVEEAMRNNPQVKSFEYQRDAAEFRANAVRALPAPGLGMEFSQIPTSSANIVNGAIANTVSLSQMFMLGGKLASMAEVERRRGSVIGQNGAAFQVQLRGRIKMAYYQLWLLDRQIEIRENALGLLETLVQTMRPHVLTNRMRQADLLTIQAEEAAERAKVQEKRARREGLLSQLNALMGRTVLSTPVAIDTMLPAVAWRDGESLLADRLRNHNPVLAAMDRMSDMNEAMMSSATKDLIPDVMLQVMIMRMPNGMILTGGQRSMEAVQASVAGMPMQKTDWMYSLMVSVTLPFMPWSSERSSGRADEARSTNLSIGAEREGMLRDMLASLRTAYVKYETNDSLAHQYAAEILPLSTGAAEAQTIAYLNGQVPITTVLDARRMELMKKEDHAMVLVERQMALVEIEMMVGSPLTFIDAK